MTKTKSCTIRLLNKPYEIKCPEDEADNLRQAALKLNAHMLEQKKKFKQLDDYQTLLLAALHISHECITSQAKQEERRQQLTQFISSLENKINQLTTDTPSPDTE
ncbi:cell division protein ZapA [Legionella nagasakiensis]|uniref:cell division protein ZapA n=1 Tax=Legionella nagasakiensis TaxID=535290 RepID=UPI00105620EE|nr:cell division protein ZapA [Legionella nagasakiensis]